jgi:CubicO group peptidase (beta-lactamase class C family)
MTFGQRELFKPMGAEISQWHKDADGYYFGHFGLFTTARDMAKFGKLYLHEGEFDGKRLLPAEWVRASFRRYSTDINWTGWISSELGSYFEDLGYGYQWWSAKVGEHSVDFAWGHGGQLIVLVHDLDMVVVSVADPLYELPGEGAWEYEGAVIDVVGKFIASLPKGGS